MRNAGCTICRGEECFALAGGIRNAECGMKNPKSEMGGVYANDADRYRDVER